MRRANIRVAEPILNGNEREYVMDCLDSTWISSRGKYIQQFEQQFAEFCGVDHAVATNNGTTALHLALAANHIGPNDEVIVPSLTYVASVNAICYCGATPVLVDSHPSSLALDPADVERKITDRTRAIISVPLYGHPVDCDAMGQIAQSRNLVWIEDAAEALGARYGGRMVGSLGNCATFSFFGNKIITTGEGGMVVTDDPNLADRLRFLRGQAVSSDRAYWHTDVGFNYRMTNIAAAIGCAQLEQIESHLQRRQQVASWYFAELEPYRHWLQLPDAAERCHHCFWMFSVLLQPELSVNRDELIEKLGVDGIETRPLFYPVHLMPPYRQPDGTFPVAESCSARGLSLPTHGALTRQDVRYVCQQLIERIRTTAEPTLSVEDGRGAA